ncbi:MAG: hypothetical protein WD471_00425 [Candidatus Paceibacterota bacterium]
MIIPSVNCKDESCIKNRFKQINDFNCEWVHLDITDGKFSNWKTWSNPKFLKEEKLTDKYKIEVHLMVENPESIIDDWIDVGASRVIVHIESNFDPENIYKKIKNSEVELMLALKPDTPLSELDKFDKDYFSFVQVLGVDPGPSGSGFQNHIPDKIRDLRDKYKDVKIEVDGGINEKTTKLVKEAGADFIVSASYIFNSENSKENYDKLLNI